MIAVLASTYRKHNIKLISVTSIIIAYFAFTSPLKFSELCEFRNESDYAIHGRSCWTRSISFRNRLSFSNETTDRYTDIEIPLQLISSWENFKFGPHRVVELKLSMVRFGISKEKNRKHLSFATLHPSIGMSTNGLKKNSELFAESKRHILIETTDTFMIYEQVPTKVSWKFYVPKHQGKRRIYMRCDNYCRLYGSYRGVIYDFNFPSDWKESYLELQNLFERFLDGIIVQNSPLNA